MHDLERVKMVQYDCETDAKAMDGQPFTGRVVGDQLGKMLASIDCLAKIVQGLLEREQQS
jgi:hypothetical protein